MERDQASKFVNDLLRLMVSRNGSDLFLTADFPPAIKVDGKITKVSPQPLTGQHTMALARAVMNDKQAAEFERTKECNFAISPAGHRALPRQRLHAAGPRRPGVAHDPADDPDDRRPGPAAGAEGRRDDQARAGRSSSAPPARARAPRWRRWSTTATRTRYGHIITDRRPGRVRAPAQELHRHAARGRHRHRQLGSGAEEHAAPGARRDPDGRDPRPRDDGARGGLRRDRPPVHGHAARQQRQPGAGPHHQLLPRRAARAAADGPVAEPEGAGLAAPAAAPGRQGPHRRGRDPAEHAADLAT